MVAPEGMKKSTSRAIEEPDPSKPEEAKGSGDENDEAVPIKPPDEIPNEEEEKPRHYVPGICRLKMFKTCRLMCFRDPSKPKLTLTQICCPKFLAARAQATRFKVSWSLLVDSEKQI